jgi:hypothetical protein
MRTSLYTSTPLRDKPIQEIIIASNGMLLSTMYARYATLTEYVEQFAAPLSRLKGSALYTFADPMWPGRTLLLRCPPEPLCFRCGYPEAVCECMF